MMNATQLEWGWKSPAINGPALWGARCIPTTWESTEVRNVRGYGRRPCRVTKRTLDILWGRQGMVGPDEAKQELKELLNGGALEALREQFAKGKLGEPDTEEHITLRGVNFHLRTAGGYVYVTAAKEG